MRAKIGTIANDGTDDATRSPGAAKARMAESSTSSEPQPVTIMSAGTSSYSASASLRSPAYSDG